MKRVIVPCDLGGSPTVCALSPPRRPAQTPEVLEALIASYAERAGRLEVGVPADLVLIDPEHEWVVSSESLLSKSKNTAFDGWKMRARALVTLVDGRIVHDLRPNGASAARS